MLNHYRPAYWRAAARSLQQLPCRIVVNIPVLRLSTSRSRSHQKRNAGSHVDVRAAVRRHYATGAEAARSMEENRPTVDLDLTSKHGGTTTIEIRPSYPQKPKAVENLLAGLPALLTDAGMPTSAVTSFATQGWDLDESGDTIHRYVEVTSEQDISSIRDQIKTASYELNHDPHIHTDGKQLTISCTTHVPPGLSMKDVKLARKINNILAEINMADVRHDDEVDILTQRQRGREYNMAAIRKAKLACSCG